MRIVQISDNLPPYHKGGAEVSCAAIITELRSKGHEVSGVTNTPAALKERVPHTIYVDSHCFWGSRDLDRIRQNYADLKREIVKLAPDVVHVHSTEGRLHGALLLARDFPTVYTAHNYTMEVAYSLRPSYFLKHPRDIVAKPMAVYLKHLLKRDRRYIEYMLRDNVPELKKVICPSFFMEKRLREVIDADRLVVIHNGVEDAYADKAARYDPLQMLFVGRMDKSKGIEYIILAAQQLASTGQPIAVTILGGGEHEPHLRAQIRKLGVEKLVTILPPVARVDYSRYDGVLVYPSVWEENCSMTILEALSAGKVVICTGQGGNKELVTHMRDGLVVAPRDHQGIADQLMQLRQQPELAATLSKNARASFLEKFTVRRQVEALERLYCQILA